MSHRSHRSHLSHRPLFSPPLPYHVVALGDGFAVCDRRLDDHVVRFFRLRSSADTNSVLGNLWGRCTDPDCLRPAVAKSPASAHCFCVEHFPDHDEWGLVPIPALRLSSEI